MVNRSELLLKCGFIKKNKEKYKPNPSSGEYEPIEGYSYTPEDADEEERETTFHQEIAGKYSVYEKTGFPAPKKTYRLSLEVYDLSLEEPYFWIVEDLNQNFPIVEKLEDSFAAAENSAFFGVTQQRIGAQQDKVSQFLATTGKMIKELFQMVRELRIIDERLIYYDEAEKETVKPIKERGKSSEITLKGIFVDLVQGGGKSAASVYGMARELEFITLPDLFFDAPPFRNSEELEIYVKAMKENFNENVLRVLIRHLRQFLEWRKRTHQEHVSRKQFQLSYLKQHFEIIQMYLLWVKPYLRHVERLTLKEKNMRSPEIVTAFESSMLDIELLASIKKKITDKIEGYECLLVTFHYRTRPELKVVQEGYQRGPVHVGKFEMNFRVYHWLKDEVEAYKKLKEKEALLLVGDVSASVQEAMNSLGNDLTKYLDEARSDMEKKKEHETKKGIK
ncbi:hypothetical protein HYX12_04435, partial [Candidatus Woesearchaeota archaeon]|nr:hypothetical protein [Candidatus Woesearchaeota archaeon]